MAISVILRHGWRRKGTQKHVGMLKLHRSCTQQVEQRKNAILYKPKSQKFISIQGAIQAA